MSEEISFEDLELIPFTSPALKEAPQQVDLEKDDLKAIKFGLLQAMQKFGGVGLSANQVGIDKACFVIGDGKPEGMQKAFFNPLLIAVSDEEEVMKEGCLSFPGLWLMVKRPKQCTIMYHTSEGEEKTETYEGIGARVILHEYDHMVGQNMTQRVSKLKLERAFKSIEKKIKKYQRQQKHLKQA